MQEITYKNYKQILAKLIKDKHISIDTETYGLGWKEGAFMVGFGTKQKKCFYLRDSNSSFNYIIKYYLIEFNKNKLEPIFANAKFDLHRFDWLNCETLNKFHDVITLSQLLHPEHFPHRLKVIGERFFGEAAKLDETKVLEWFNKNNARKKEYWKLPDKLILPYLEQDLNLTRQLFDLMKPKLKNYTKLESLYNNEMELTRYVLFMEKRGILVDRIYLEKLQSRLEMKNKKLLFTLQKSFKVNKDFNFNSDKQLSELLYDKLKFPILFKTYKGAASVNDEALSHIKYPTIKELRQYKLNETYLTKFVIPWLEHSKIDGRLHANFNQNGAISGRFTCNEPNLQQIMKDKIILRGLLVEENFVMGQSDLSQIEIVGAAWYNRDDRMLSALRDDIDLHTDTASIIFNKPKKEISKVERSIAKGMNFAVIYGCGKAKLALFLSKYAGKEITLDQAAKIRNQYHLKFPKIQRFSYQVSDVIKQRKDRIIKNYFGRRFYIQPNKEYIGINRLVQSWAADVAKFAMVKIGKKLNWTNQFMSCQVHDMIAWECKKKDLKEIKNIVEKCMTDFPEFDVPVKVDTTIIKKDWGEII